MLSIPFFAMPSHPKTKKTTSARPARKVKSRRATIRDVAEACGLAQSTVSNALSRQRYVSEETRLKVEQAAQKVGYRASYVARSLRTQKTWSLGILVGDITNPFFPELVRGAEDIASAQGYNLILCNTDYRADKQKAYVNLLFDKQVDGLIISSQIQEAAGLAELHKLHVPMVLINQSYPNVDVDYVGVDNERGMADACQYLWGLGHRRIGFILGREGSSAAQDRFNGFVRAMEKLAGGYDKSLVRQGDWTYASGTAAAREILAIPNRPTAIVGANDLMALGAIEAMQEFGLRVPDDLSIIGIDDIFVSAMPWASLTTLRHPKWTVGATAARILIERIGDPDQPPRRVMIAPEFIVRGTSRAAPAN